MVPQIVTSTIFVFAEVESTTFPKRFFQIQLRQYEASQRFILRLGLQEVIQAKNACIVVDCATQA